MGTNLALDRHLVSAEKPHDGDDANGNGYTSRQDPDQLIEQAVCGHDPKL